MYVAVLSLRLSPVRPSDHIFLNRSYVPDKVQSVEKKLRAITPKLGNAELRY